MLPLKQRIIWKKNLVDADKNTLTVRIEKEQVISEEPKTPDRMTHSLEICSPTEDRRGRAIKKRMRVPVDNALFREIKEAISTFAQLTTTSRRKQDCTIEIRYECSRGLIITRESPPFEDVSKSEIRYVIGNGREVRFVFGSFDDLDTLRWDLENALI